MLEGRMEWLEINGVDRWLGGVHLRGDARWRRNGATRRLQRRDV
jgi:hypothetical protein